MYGRHFYFYEILKNIISQNCKTIISLLYFEYTKNCFNGSVKKFSSLGKINLFNPTVSDAKQFLKHNFMFHFENFVVPFENMLSDK